MEEKAGAQTSQREGKRMRVAAPIRKFERHSMPLNACPAKELIEAERSSFHHDITAQDALMAACTIARRLSGELELGDPF